MSKYTTEVRYLCEHFAWLHDNKDLPIEEQTPEHSYGYENVNEIIGKARPEIFGFQYPLFDDNYRPVLETKILKHYYTREIAEETYGLWKLRLETKLNEIMPYYNKLYESELLEFDPLRDADYYREGNRTDDTDNTRTDNLNQRSVDSGSDTRETNTEFGGSDTTEGERVDKYSQWNLYSDTPQGGIAGIQGAEDGDSPALDDNGYLTNATHVLHDGTGTNDSSTTEYGQTRDTDETMNYGKINNTANTGTVGFEGTTESEYLEHIYGKFPGKSFSQMLDEYRKVLLNIDMMIINELKPLFFNLW